MSDIEQWSEAVLYGVVTDLAKRTGWMYAHITDSRRSPAVGFPDLVLVHPITGRVLFRELKTSKGKLRPEQAEWLNALSTHHDACIWRPIDWAEGLIQNDLQGRHEAFAPLRRSGGAA